MQVIVKPMQSFAGLNRVLHHAGRLFDRAIRRLEDRHRGELPYMRRREPEIISPSLKSIRAKSEENALPAALAVLRAMDGCPDRTAMKALADDMAALTSALHALSANAADRPVPPGDRREPVWGAGLGDRFQALAKTAKAMTAPQANPARNKTRR